MLAKDSKLSRFPQIFIDIYIIFGMECGPLIIYFELETSSDKFLKGVK